MELNMKYSSQPSGAYQHYESAQLDMLRCWLFVFAMTCSYLHMHTSLRLLQVLI